MNTEYDMNISKAGAWDDHVTWAAQKKSQWGNMAPPRNLQIGKVSQDCIWGVIDPPPKQARGVPCSHASTMYGHGLKLSKMNYHD